ncbi:MAG TPA: hypothetical protein VGG10_12805 [Rhizomicrobium sp.]|jgi:hypothetical protein
MPFKRGAPPGNKNRLIHGLYSREIAERRRAVRHRKRMARMVLARVAIIIRTREALAGKVPRARQVPRRRRFQPVIRKHGQFPRFRAFELLPPPRWRRLMARFKRAEAIANLTPPRSEAELEGSRRSRGGGP